jgi:hypothetical protein
MAALRAVRDPFTGRPLFDDLSTGVELYGPVLGATAPEVVGQINTSVCHFGPSNPVDRRARAGRWFSRNLASAMKGVHSPRGIYIARGASFAPRGRCGEMHITDLTALILRVCGVAVPEGFDGVVEEALLCPEAARREPQAVSRDDAPAAAKPATSPAAEDDTVKQRLRALGYL